MGRKGRHTARTGDGGGELRHKQRLVKDAQREQKQAELQFFDDPSDDEQGSQDGTAESEGSEYGDEEEVLRLGEDGSDDDEEEEEDSDNADEDDDVDEFGDDGEEDKNKLRTMDAKWGKSKKAFYSADTAEFEVDEDEDAARDEEDAALELQRRQAEMMDDEDFDMEEEPTHSESDDEQAEDDAVVDDEALLGDQLADLSSLADDGGRAAVEVVQKDFSKMTKKDKLRIVNQTAPELLGLTAELESTLAELREVVTPAILKLKDVRRRTNAYNTGLQYLVTRQNLMLNYVANISFYLLLRAEGKSVTDHPVLQHLLALKKQMNRLQDVDDTVNSQLHDLLTQEFPTEDDGMDQFFGLSTSKDGKKSKRARGTMASVPATSNSSTKKQKISAGGGVSAAERAEAAAFYEAAAGEKRALGDAKKKLYTHEKPGLASSDEDDDEDDEGVAGANSKRGASYEIIKNQGLKAHKNKLNRNPRLKKRMQYRKAVIRRKGQVRDVRVGESGRYGGESTGIKTNLTRSRKIGN